MNAIVTQRLIIKPSTRHDSVIRQLCRWLNDPEIVQYSEQRHLRHTSQSELHYIADNLATFREIYAGDELIGTINADIDENNGIADVGILIGNKDKWNKGYGFEAWAAYCNNLLNNGTRKIEAGTMALNTGMIKIFRKYEMRYEGRREEHFSLGPQLVDMVMWGKFGE